MNVGEEKCLVFLVSSSDYSGNLNSVMKWAEKGSEVSSINDFTLSNSETELNVDYSPEEIFNFDGEEEINVCISADELGIWKGSLEYRTESEGNVGVGVGTWLRVNVSEEPTEDTPKAPPSSTGSGGGSSGGGGGSAGVLPVNTSPENSMIPGESNEGNKASLGELENESSELTTNSGITGFVTGFTDTKTGKGVLIAVLAIIAIFVGSVIYKKNFKR